MYFFNILVLFDQAANVVFFGGWPDETISARCWREQFASRGWARLGGLVDFVALRVFGVRDHCERSFLFEIRHRGVKRRAGECD